jgi:NifU-like protein involved in Fe-S cluster formation
MYSDTIMDHFHNPRNAGKLPTCNAKGVAGDPSAGPFMIFYLEIHSRIVKQASFETYGCPPAIAAGSYLTEFVKGKSIEELSLMDSQKLSELLGGIPLGKEHCPQIAVAGLKAALNADSPTAKAENAGP